MPGIDFDVLRNEITIDQVLDLLEFQPSSVSGDQLLDCVRFMAPHRTRAARFQ